MKHVHAFLFAIICTTAFSFAACSTEEVEFEQNYHISEDVPFVLSDYYTGEADSSYALSFAIRLQNGQLTVQGLKPTIGFPGLLATTSFVTGVKIAQFGKAKNLGEVNSIPAAGAFGDKSPVECGYGYVVMAFGTQDIEAIGATTNHPGFFNPDTLYLRLVLTEELKEGGFNMAYAFPFVPSTTEE